MSLRVHITDDRCLHATVHEQPSWFARIFLRCHERDYEVWRIRDMGSRFVWVTHDNRPVAKRVAAAIERAVAVRARNEAARQQFIRLVRGGR